MKDIKKTASLLACCSAIFILCFSLPSCSVDDHDGHNHETAAPEKDAAVAHDDHGEDDAEAADTHDGEQPEAPDHEEEIEVAPEAMELAGITMAKAGLGTIGTAITVSGEVGFNEDRLMRITPRFSGIAREIRCKVGEFVKEGDVVAVIESNESMTRYPIKAPISGWIIEKKASLGEYVSEEKNIYVLADLSTVWVNLAVYPKDAAGVSPGQSVSIFEVGSDNGTAGTVHYVTPVMDPETRRITARVILPNGDNAWRPGSFVNARIEIGQSPKGVVVEKDAVQMLDNKSIVFTQHEPGRFEPIEVVTGEHDGQKIRILDGLKEGDEYVSNGAFELKAKIVTGSLGDHAGHGH